MGPTRAAGDSRSQPVSSSRKTPKKRRRKPLQARSAATVAAILEATAQVLTARGYEGTTTNLIAERAGVSVGSLYQYFPNKDALIAELVERDFVEITERLLALIPALRERGLRDVAPQVSRVLIEHHSERPYRSQAVFLSLTRVLGLERVDVFLEGIEQAVAEVFEDSAVRIRPEPELAARVIVRALAGIVQNTMRREPERFADPQLGEELVILMVGYLMPDERDELEVPDESEESEGTGGCQEPTS